MSALLREEPLGPRAPDDVVARTTVLHVDSVPYRQSAATFWPALIDEVHDLFPDSTAFELIAPAPGRLGTRHLDPAAALSEDLQRLATVDVRAGIANTLAELALLGGPAPVRIRILDGDRELLARDMPSDSLDADILPYLVAWLLEWARVPLENWNDPFNGGHFIAEDRVRRITYRIDFGLRRDLLSEELYQWSLCIMPLVATV